ncbi:LysR substrate binding domain protein [compost metagenome]
MHNYVVERHLNSGALVRVLADFKTPVRSIHALYPAARGLSPKIGAFIDYALNSVESAVTRKIAVA